MTLDRAWMGSDSTFFLQFRFAVDRLRTLSAKRKLFFLPSKIFLAEDLFISQVAELKRSREQVTATCQGGKWAVIRNLRVVIMDSFHHDRVPCFGVSK